MRTRTTKARELLLVVLAASAGPAAHGLGAQESNPRPMTVDDALDIVSVGSALMSPDGAWVLYSQRELNWEENEYETTYHMVPASGGESFQYIGEEGGSDFQFSPDGRYLSFRREVDDEQQVFLMRTAGGEAIQLTEHDTAVRSYQWAPDSRRIFFTANEKRSDEEQKEFENGDDAIFVDEGPNGQRRGSWSNFWVFDLEAEEATRITEEEAIFGSWDIAPDGNRIAVAARKTNRRNDGYRNEVHVIDVAGGTLRPVTENAVAEGSLAWSPDGRSILFSAGDDEEWLNRNSKLWLLDPETGASRLITGAFEGSISDAVWAPDGRTIFFNGQQGTNTNVFRVDVGSGAVTALTDTVGTLEASSFSKDRSAYVYSFSDYRTPPDLHVTKTGSSSSVRLTEANPQTEGLILADMQLVRWQSKDDFTIEGLLHSPPGADERVPLMLNIHGGPAGAFTNSWRASYHIYAGLGYASLSPNVRGSRGYTDKLREGNTVQKGDGIGIGDYEDLITGVDHVIAAGVADPDRLGLRGWSYGGILGGWTITRTDRFQAASIGAGVYDWTSEYGPGFNHDVRLWHIGGTPWDNAEAWREQSALTHVANVVTPTLLIHGENDRTDTEQQSMMFFTALKDIGKAEVRYIKFPREPHGFREPRHQRVRDVEEIRWMQKHVMGEEWTPWERPTADAEENEKKVATDRP
jgi:dipeptidyl aminopeptidase/acylaminoacyl peptidase